MTGKSNYFRHSWDLFGYLLTYSTSWLWGIKKVNTPGSIRIRTLTKLLDAEGVFKPPHPEGPMS